MEAQGEVAISSRAIAELKAEGLRKLRALGAALDRGEEILVFPDGRVEPGSGCPQSATPGTDQGGQYAETTRDAARSEGSTSRTRSGDSRSPAPEGRQEASGPRLLSIPGVSGRAGIDLEGVAAAYPGARFVAAPDGVWILTRLCPVRELAEHAYLVTRYPLNGRSKAPPRSWAFWRLGHLWVGPRHTNPPGGTICSYEVRHGTWTPYHPLWQLLDFNAVWVARHLFLRCFGRWPGRQVLHTAYERLRDHVPGELCGCGSMRLYEQCHRASDVATSPYDRILEWRSTFPNPDIRLEPEARRMLIALLRAPTVPSMAK